MFTAQQLSRLGGLVSVAGTGMFLVIVVSLLAFPVGKQCLPTTGQCKYVSMAPDEMKAVVRPGFLAISLLLISTGIVAVRLGRRIGTKKEPGS